MAALLRQHEKLQDVSKLKVTSGLGIWRVKELSGNTEEPLYYNKRQNNKGIIEEKNLI